MCKYLHFNFELTKIILTQRIQILNIDVYYPILENPEQNEFTFTFMADQNILKCNEVENNCIVSCPIATATKWKWLLFFDYYFFQLLFAVFSPLFVLHFAIIPVTQPKPIGRQIQFDSTSQPNRSARTRSRLNRSIGVNPIFNSVPRDQPWHEVFDFCLRKFHKQNTCLMLIHWVIWQFYSFAICHLPFNSILHLFSCFVYRCFVCFAQRLNFHFIIVLENWIDWCFWRFRTKQIFHMFNDYYLLSIDHEYSSFVHAFYFYYSKSCNK